MAIYDNVKLVTEDIYEATVIPQSFIDKLRLAYIVIFHHDRIRCSVHVRKDWFDDNITDKDIEAMNNIKRK